MHILYMMRCIKLTPYVFENYFNVESSCYAYFQLQVKFEDFEFWQKCPGRKE